MHPTDEPSHKRASIYIKEYCDRAFDSMPELSLIAHKWNTEDLVLGYSDLDIRFVTSSRHSLKSSLPRMSGATVNLHLNLVATNPDLQRLLEHLPGVILSEQELYNPNSPDYECGHWNFYHRTQHDVRIPFLDWSDDLEEYHYSRLLDYFRREPFFCRAVNSSDPFGIGYRFHVRTLRYFAIIALSAVSIIERGTVLGKIQAMRRVCTYFPDSSILADLLESVRLGYSCIKSEKGLALLNSLLYRLESLLLLESTRRLSYQRGIQLQRRQSLRHQVRAALVTRPINHKIRFLQTYRYARLMSARLKFYVLAPESYQSAPLIREILPVISRNFCQYCIEDFSVLYLRKRVEWPFTMDLFKDLSRNRIQYQALLHLHKLSSAEIPPDQEREHAALVVPLLTQGSEALEQMAQLLFPPP